MDRRQQKIKRRINCLVRILYSIIFLSYPFLSCAENRVGNQMQLQSAGELDYPPFSIITPDGKAGGFSVELLQAAVEAAGRTISFKVSPWHELKQELAEGKLDVLPLVSYSKERDKVYDFTAPYLKMNGTVFVRKGNTTIETLADLRGKEVLVMEGDTAHEYTIREHLTDKIFPTNTYDEAFRLLSQGKHDAIVVQQIVGLQMIKKLHIKNVVAVQNKHITTLKPAALKLNGFEQIFCFAVQEGNHQLLSELNEGLTVLYLNGTYETLYQKWFAPILPPPEHSIGQIIKEALVVLVPLLLILAVSVMWYFKRLVAKKTLFLKLEIGERKRIEKELEEANANYIQAQKLGKVGNWTYDIATEQFFGSAEAKRIYGLDMNSPSYTREAVHSCIVERDRAQQALNDFLDKGIPYNIEYTIHTKDTGERRTILSRAELKRDSSGNPVQLTGMIQDITESRHAADALQSSERLLNEMGAIALIGGWEHDLITRKATWTKETFKIIEIESETIPGPDEHLDFYLPEDRAILRKEYQRTVETGKPFDLRLQYTTAKGRLIWARVIGHPEYKDGQCIKMRGTFQDITERMKYVTNLMQSQRLESLGVLSGGIAHDFNNILSAILGFTELAKDNNPDNRQLQEDLNEIYTAGVRARELVMQIMAVSRKQEYTPSPVHVPDIVMETMKMLRSTFPATIEIELLIDENIRPVLADETQLHQVIMNICTNAKQAMENQGGVLTIKVTETTPSETLLAHHPALRADTYVQLHFQDTGTGIEPRILHSIFDPYFTTKNHGDGTGLGLAVTYGIVHEMAGDIVVESLLGKGSVFTVFLPITDQGPQDIANDDPSPKTFPRGDQHILIVDDELPILKSTSRILESNGYTVTAEENGRMALERFKNNPLAYDLVLSDVTMPKISGDQLAKEILLIRPDIPVLLASGYSNTVTEASVMENGIQCLLQKPFTEQQLLTAIHQALITPSNKISIAIQSPS